MGMFGALGMVVSPKVPCLSLVVSPMVPCLLPKSPKVVPCLSPKSPKVVPCLPPQSPMVPCLSPKVVPPKMEGSNTYRKAARVDPPPAHIRTLWVVRKRSKGTLTVEDGRARL